MSYDNRPPPRPHVPVPAPTRQTLFCPDCGQHFPQAGDSLILPDHSRGSVHLLCVTDEGLLYDPPGQLVGEGVSAAAGV